MKQHQIGLVCLIYMLTKKSKTKSQVFFEWSKNFKNKFKRLNRLIKVHSVIMKRIYRKLKIFQKDDLSF